MTVSSENETILRNRRKRRKSSPADFLRTAGVLRGRKNLLRQVLLRYRQIERFLAHGRYLKNLP